MLRVLQGASLVLKELAKLQAEAAPVHRGGLKVPVQWKGAAAGRAGSSKDPLRPQPPGTPATRGEASSSAAAAATATSAATSAPTPPQPAASKASSSSERQTWRRVQPVDAANGAAFHKTAVPPSASSSSDPSSSSETGTVGGGRATTDRATRAVPAHAISRAAHFGSLGLGLAAGAASEAFQRALGGQSGGSVLATDANVERLASTLCRLRGAALKVGQMLSFNDADVLPPAMRVAMERVRDGADWMPPNQLEATLREELGDDWRSRLASFEETPVAAASIGQVHRAVLDDGRPVAIKVQYPGVAESISSDLWSMKQLVFYTGIVPPGLFLDRVLEVAQRELMQECDYEIEAAATKQFKLNLSPYPDLSVPAVVPSLSSKRVLTTEWMPGTSIDRAAAEQMSVAERDRVGSTLLWLSLSELFQYRFMQTDPNWSNFLYDARTQQISLIDFGACQSYDPEFVDAYLRLVRACAEGESQREAILHWSHELDFLTGSESREMLDAHVSAAVLVGSPFDARKQPFDFGAQDISKRIAADVGTMIKHRLTPPREEIYTLHRRLNGCFQLASRVGATIPAREILLDVYNSHQWHQPETQSEEGAHGVGGAESPLREAIVTG